MHTWPVQDAKARFRELLDTCLEDGAQAVSKTGLLLPLRWCTGGSWSLAT